MNQPVIVKKPDVHLIGKVDGTRGSGKLFDPPIHKKDDYKWIRDDSRSNNEVLDLLKTENNYTESVMSSMDDTREKLYNDLMSNVTEDYDTFPLPPSRIGWESQYCYFTRFQKGKSYRQYCRLDQETKEENILVDVNIKAEGHKTFDLSGFKVNRDQTIMGYGVDTNGSEKYQLHLENIADGSIIDHSIPPLLYCSYSWFENTIYYTQGDEQNRVYQLWRYNINTHESILIHQCDDELFHVALDVNEDDGLMYLYVNSEKTTNLFYFNHSDEGVPDLHQFTDIQYEHKYSVSLYGDKFIITTNKDDSTNFKVMCCSRENTSQSNWVDLIPYNEDIYVSCITFINGFMLMEFNENGNTFLKVFPIEGNNILIDSAHVIIVEDDIKNIGIIQTIYHDDKFLFYHNSLSKPITYYQYNMKNRDCKAIYTKVVPNYDSSLYKTERIYAKSHDGVMVPISIIYNKELFKCDGTNPLYLYGYGSYGITIDPNFNKNILPLLNRGFVYAIAHVRGGSFLGYKWYESGKMRSKMNTFLDFNSCAEHLITEKYTGNKLITIEGRSAGGLLVGACMVMRPELFRTVIAGVPFVDVINTMADPSIPLTVPEWEQWGNPNVEEDYEYMMKYSPYDNIRSNDYPNILALAGLHDPRVGYWEPAKFIAKLREHATNKDTLVLLKTELEQGHFGQTDRYKHLRDLAHDYSFVLKTYED